MAKSNRLINLQVDLKIIEFIIKRAEDDILQMHSLAFCSAELEERQNELIHARADRTALLQDIYLELAKIVVNEPHVF